jgi:uncharacterized membrane protein (DUF485 family)
VSSDPRGDEDRLRELARRRWAVAGVLSAIMIVVYFGFILLVAFAQPTAGMLLADGGVSLGIVLGAAVILVAPILTAIYVRWANRRYDHAVRALREDAAP